MLLIEGGDRLYRRKQARKWFTFFSLGREH
jgi:hypothetical protein